MSEEANLFLHIKFSRGFDLRESKILALKDCDRLNVNVVIQASFFDFYAKNQEGNYKQVNIGSSLELIKSYHNLTKQVNTSRKSRIMKMYNSFRSILSDIDASLYFSSNVIIRSKLSRILFKDATLKSVAIFKLANTSLRRHLFQIEQNDDLFRFNNDDNQEIANKTVAVQLNSQVLGLILQDLFNIRLNEELLDTKVFADLIQISIVSPLTGIDDQAFRSFNKLELLEIILVNFREFWHSSADNKWLMHLNEDKRNLNFTIKEDADENLLEENLEWYRNSYFTLLFHDLSNNRYDYPNEDICLFRHFPHQNAVFYRTNNDPYFHTVKNQTLIINTCTLHHLYRYSSILKFILKQNI